MSSTTHQPLASALVRRIFALYLILAVVLTIFQINIEYRNTYSTVLAEIDAAAHAFEPGISDAVWNFQKPFLESITQGMISGGVITGVEINDVYQHLNLTRTRNSTQFDALSISKKIPLFHTYSDGTLLTIGSMTIYSNHKIIIERVRLGILLILIAAAIKTIGLWLIIVFFANQLLAKPLGRFTEQIKFFDLASTTQAPKIDLGITPSQELIDLRDTFHALAAKAVASKHIMLQKEVAEAATLTKSRFLAAASHDLRQPAHALNLYLAALTGLDSSESMQNCVDNMKKCVNAMNNMLDTLLDISSIDAGATQAHLHAFPLAMIFERIKVEFEPLAHAKGLSLRIAACNAWVHSDDEIVERMLSNLVSNAIRYTQQGKVLIGCRRRAQQLRVAVYDTGCGIEQSQQQAIFEEYYQINNHERHRTKGFGLGLAIVERLSRLLAAPIRLQSLPNKGSMFAFDLPRSERLSPQQLSPLLPPAPNHLPSPPALRAAQRMILVIDDEQLILDATRTLLEKWGYAVISATNGHEAMQQLASQARRPDMIICDYLLAGQENGITVITSLRAFLKQSIPALLITGATLPDHIKAMHASHLPLMHKPLDHDQLKVTLMQMIG